MNSYDKVIDLLRSENVFLTGGAGVGKSYLTKKVVDYYKAECLNVVVLGSTGISAVNVGGQTIHSLFAFGIANNFEELKSFDKYNKNRLRELTKILKKLHLLIIDEISMVSADLLEMILYRLRSGGFKGKLMVVGDFYQLPPVVKQKNNDSLLGEAIYAFESSAWEYFDFVTVELMKVHRTSDEDFMRILNFVRRGRLNEEVFCYLESLRENNFDMTNATTLFGRNYEADILNSSKVASIPTQEFVKKAEIEIKDAKVDTRRIERWKKTLPVVEDLALKEGVPVIFTTNRWGFYHNGEKAVIEHIDEDSIVVQKNHRLVKVERFDFELSHSVLSGEGNLDSEVVCTFSQFPLRPAYGITIHKSQGMSLDHLVCNVDHIFADSQFYVALSRATEPKRLKIAFSRGDFRAYLHRVVKVSDRVSAFYENLENLVQID
jgi:ATP-dependent exoDNAse (exonuclease V) alpha subunit